jgi:hypothetical protein
VNPRPSRHEGAADVSVDHPEVVGGYREGHRLSQLSARGEASTEDLRQSMQDYRRLFDERLEPSADDPTRRKHAELRGASVETDDRGRT